MTYLCSVILPNFFFDQRITSGSPNSSTGKRSKRACEKTSNVKNCFAYGSMVNFLAQTATPQPVNYKSFINQMSINLFT